MISKDEVLALVIGTVVGYILGGVFTKVEIRKTEVKYQECLSAGASVEYCEKN
jgi:hypothetical protein